MGLPRWGAARYPFPVAAPPPPPSYNCPPNPDGAADIQRWNEARRRRRLLAGSWGCDLEERLRMHFGLTRRLIIGPRSLAKNPFRRLCAELACLYTSPPVVGHRDGDVPGLLGEQGLLSQMGLWPLMGRLQMQLIGLREMGLRLDWSPSLARPVARLVTPDTITAEAHSDDPGTPVEVRELRWRTIDGRGRWAWDILSIRDPAAPFFRVIEHGEGGLDLTGSLFGQSFDGALYPYRWTEGARAGHPYLPFELYHASHPGALFEPDEGIEVVDGTLDVAAGWTYLQHVLFRAAFPQRWVLGARVAGAAPVHSAAGPRVEIPTDPSSLIHLEVEQGVTSPDVGQWGPGADPEVVARTVEKLEAAVAAFDGIDNSHVLRSSSNPWSAAALQISNEGKRAAQRRYGSLMQAADLRVVEKVAALWNLSAEGGAAVPESGYRIKYAVLPLSREEAEERRKNSAELIAQGRMSTVDAYLSENPGLTRAEAEAELARISEENNKFGVRPGTAPTPIHVDPAHTDPPTEKEDPANGEG